MNLNRGKKKKENSKSPKSTKEIQFVGNNIPIENRKLHIQVASLVIYITF